jgi:pyruvate/2-oxoglutarate dehydrogenase complex dihydrolipoamide dehydrogenase (E3) component
MPMQRVGPARETSETSETQGFAKVPIEAGTERILGASILELNGDEVMHSLLDMIRPLDPSTGGACRAAALQRQGFC